MYKMRGVFTEYERMKIKERFRLGVLRKAKEGHVIATEAPFGYMFVPKKGKAGDSNFRQGYYKINEHELPILKNIFLWASDGVTLHGIVAKLQSLGIPPRKSKRGVWNGGTLSKILRNKTYIGEGHFGATVSVMPAKPLKSNVYKKNKKSSRKIKPESEWIKIPTPAIIELELFNRVQEQLKINSARSIRNTKNEYLLSGKIHCNCGIKRLGAGAANGKQLYYRCVNRMRSFPLPQTCFEKGIDARVADNLVWGELVKIITNSSQLEIHYGRWQNQEDKVRASTTNLDRIENEIKRLKSQEERLLKAYTAEIISMEQLQANTKPIQKKLVSLNDQLTNLRESNLNEESKAPSWPSSALGLLPKIVGEKLESLNFHEKRCIVEAFIEKVVGNKEQLVVTGYIPIELIRQNNLVKSPQNINVSARKISDVALHPNHMHGSNTIQKNYVVLNTNHRNATNTIRQINLDAESKSIPFELTIPLAQRQRHDTTNRHCK